MQYQYLCLSPDRLVQMATVLGEKVRIEKGRQNDNEEGKLKTSDKESKDTQDVSRSWSKGNENDKEAYYSRKKRWQ